MSYEECKREVFQGVSNFPSFREMEKLREGRRFVYKSLVHLACLHACKLSIHYLLSFWHTVLFLYPCCVGFITTLTREIQNCSRSHTTYKVPSNNKHNRLPLTRPHPSMYVSCICLSLVSGIFSLYPFLSLPSVYCAALFPPNKAYTCFVLFSPSAHQLT